MAMAKIDDFVLRLTDASSFAKATVLNEIDRRFSALDVKALQNFLRLSDADMNHGLFVASKLLGALETEKCLLDLGWPINIDRWLTIASGLEIEKNVIKDAEDTKK